MTFALRSDPPVARLERDQRAAFEAYIAASLALAWEFRDHVFRDWETDLRSDRDFRRVDPGSRLIAEVRRTEARLIRTLRGTRRWQHGGRTWEMTAYGVRPAAGE